MIKFFRKIRKRLLLENNFSKYLVYAAGEILLVVIGILIALYINNWNETQVKRNIEINLLEGIRDDILRDTLDINFNVRGYKNSVRKDSILLQHLISKKPYDPEVAFLLTSSLSNFNLTLHSSHFEEIKERGWSTLSNTKLKDQISRLYEFDYIILKDFVNTQEDQHQILFFNKVYEYLRYNESGYLIKPKDYTALTNDERFFFLLKIQIEKRRWLLKNHETTLQKSLQVKDLIDQELMSLKK